MRVRTIMIGLTASLLVTLTACSSSTSNSPKAESPAPASASAVPTSATGSATPSAPPATTPEPTAPGAVTAGGLPPKPDEGTAAKYIAALTSIDAEIVNGKPDKAISRGRDQCSSVAQHPKDQAKLVELTAQRFIGPNHPTGFGAEKSTKILEAVRKYICPTY
ncbi:hypothetical protein [Kitasatospora sp. NPDC088351]|uniref:hypothetical protein n=1 Tax=Kitasatospora sp. NPDC088351 TaxID=3155180 RepID=UPI003441C9AB